MVSPLVVIRPHPWIVSPLPDAFQKLKFHISCFAIPRHPNTLCSYLRLSQTACQETHRFPNLCNKDRKKIRKRTGDEGIQWGQGVQHERTSVMWVWGSEKLCVTDWQHSPEDPSKSGWQQWNRHLVPQLSACCNWHCLGIDSLWTSCLYFSFVCCVCTCACTHVRTHMGIHSFWA